MRTRTHTAKVGALLLSILKRPTISAACIRACTAAPPSVCCCCRQTPNAEGLVGCALCSWAHTQQCLSQANGHQYHCSSRAFEWFGVKQALLMSVHGLLAIGWLPSILVCRTATFVLLAPDVLNCQGCRWPTLFFLLAIAATAPTGGWTTFFKKMPTAK